VPEPGRQLTVHGGTASSQVEYWNDCCLGSCDPAGRLNWWPYGGCCEANCVGGTKPAPLRVSSTTQSDKLGSRWLVCAWREAARGESVLLLLLLLLLLLAVSDVS